MCLLIYFIFTGSGVLKSNCTDFEIRFDPPSGGKILICLNGIWGTICSYGLPAEAASVVCHQSGYQRRSTIS